MQTQPQTHDLAIILGIVLALLIVGGIEAYRILYTPQALFKFSTRSPAPAGTPLPTPETTEASAGPETAAASPTAESTVAPTSDITQSNDILNILLIGVDRRQDTQGDSKGTNGGRNGTEPHADVQMVLAINFKREKGGSYSLPRDTFVYNPDLMNGVYKLNATFNTAGGFTAKDGAGFLNVCKGASYMLAGFPSIITMR